MRRAIIEIDPDLAGLARAALATVGYGEVTVICGDGARGYLGGAPFDRVLSTVAAPRVPYPWVAHTRPGGLVVTPWSSAYRPRFFDFTLQLTRSRKISPNALLLVATHPQVPTRNRGTHGMSHGTKLSEDPG